MNILFICSRNKWRSPTAETIYKNHNELFVKSAGTEPSARTRVNSKLIDWADVIFVMEKHHKQRVQENYRDHLSVKRIIILDIPDEYQYMDEELISLIQLSVSPYLPCLVLKKVDTG